MGNMSRKNLTLERLKEVLSYNCCNGVFYWKTTQHNAVHIGDVAGSKHHGGSITIRIDKQVYEAHILAWFYVYETWPCTILDHCDTIRDHNWISNLREATHAQNQMNKNRYRNNISGFKGVLFHNDKWRVRISLNKKTHELGYYSDIEMAVATRIQASWDFHGEFARY